MKYFMTSLISHLVAILHCDCAEINTEFSFNVVR